MRHILKTAPGAPVHPEPAEDSELAELTTGYAADHAARAFGIPRIAPVLVNAGRGSDRAPAPAPGFLAEAAEAAEVEDLTESLTADERQAAAAFLGAALSDPLSDRAAPGELGDRSHGAALDDRSAPEELGDRSLGTALDDRSATGELSNRLLGAALDDRLSDRAATEELGDRSLGAALSDPVTAALRLPNRRPQARTVWSGAQRLPLTERLPVSALAGPRLTAVLPPLSRSPAEAATTTVTLPAAALPGALGQPTPGGRPGARSLPKLMFFCGGAVLAGAIAGLVGLALPRVWPGAAPAPLARRPDGNRRQRLLEQAVMALRDGRPEQAITLLLRYQSGQPSGERDPTVEIMLRVLQTAPSSAPPVR